MVSPPVGEVSVPPPFFTQPSCLLSCCRLNVLRRCCRLFISPLLPLTLSSCSFPLLLTACCPLPLSSFSRLSSSCYITNDAPVLCCNTVVLCAVCSRRGCFLEAGIRWSSIHPASLTLFFYHPSFYHFHNLSKSQVSCKADEPRLSRRCTHGSNGHVRLHPMSVHTAKTN